LKKLLPLVLIATFVFSLSSCSIKNELDDTETETTERLTTFAETSIIFTESDSSAPLSPEDDGYTEPEISPEMQQYIDEYNAKEQDIYSRADNNTPPDQLITKSYPASEMIYRYGAYFSAGTYSGNKHPIVSVDERYPIECLRDMGEGSYYAVYNIKEGGRLFMFFPADAHGCFSYSLYLRAPLDKSRFEKLKPGDTIASVIDIDPSFAIAFEKKIDSFCNVASGKNSNALGTYHFFDDSLWFIEYEDLNDDVATIKEYKTKKTKILGIKQFNDKKIMIDWEFSYEGEIYADGASGIYDFNILPIDYPE
ncbi:MAG: hypothetical protein FWF08_09050, partial [Oscillospiraceae bacterium]|nr:hypothetical protein [Oscillospiraceae bacterium]